VLCKNRPGRQQGNRSSSMTEVVVSVLTQDGLITVTLRCIGAAANAWCSCIGRNSLGTLELRLGAKSEVLDRVRNTPQSNCACCEISVRPERAASQHKARPSTSRPSTLPGSVSATAR
jgi:hypothetical protein